MEQTNLIKVVAAFVAGVVVALGSALIYVRVSDMVHPPPAIIPQTTANTPAPLPAELPDAGSNTATAADQSSLASPSGSAALPDVSQPDQSRKRILAPRPAHPYSTSRVAVLAHRQAHGTSQIARNVPPAPVPAPSTAPAQYPSLTPAEQQSVPDSQLQQTQPLQPQPDDPVLATAPEPAHAQPHVVTLPAGANIAIRLAETLSTDHNYQGDTFRATLESPIVADGFVIADRGSKVLGRIVTAEKSGHVTGVANLTLALTEINTTDHQRIRIDTSLYDKRGPNSNGENTAKIAGGAALGAIIGAIAGGGKGAAIGAGAGGAAGTGAVLLTRGKAAVLPVETHLTFRLSSPVTITEKLN